MVAPLAIAGGIAAAGAASSLIGGVMANKASKAAMAQNAAFTEKAIKELEKVGVPSIEAQKIALETPEMVFKFVPQLEKEFPEIKSQFDQISVDPRLQQAQVQALQGLQERASMGLTPEEQAQLDSMRRDLAQSQQAQQNTILQQMEQRGLGGSGAELAARMSASQAQTQNAAEESDRMAAIQFQAKQAALQNLGNLAGSQRSQSFGEQSQQASAADVIAQFNAQNRAGIQQRNLAAQNQAELQRQQLRQQYSDAGVDTRNKEQTYNKGLIAQDYANRLGKAQSMSNAYSGQAQSALQAGQNQASNYMSMGQGVGQAVMGAGQLYTNAKDTESRDANTAALQQQNALLARR